MPTGHDEERSSRPGGGLDPATPLKPEESTLAGLEEEAAEQRGQVTTAPPGRTAADAELPVSERREHGMEDNVRHTGSIGRR